MTIKGFKFQGVEHLIGPIAAMLGFVYWLQWYMYGSVRSPGDSVLVVQQPPLVMRGGDPYIRPLMRTISASEASGNRSYSLLYVGQQVRDFSRHPEICVRIFSGPNKNNCSTVAGSYRIINLTQPPLVMGGGDPYIRALMRTISASEANGNRPYSLLYGGQRVQDLSRHPEICVRIVSGPNKNNCSTAAGRYQILNKTWFEIAPRYHPQRPRAMSRSSYSFAPKYQDMVVYCWLKDTRVWRTDISQLLRQGKIDNVLRRLSPTWTSLGYGIETNSMSKFLPRIYRRMLQEELRAVNLSRSRKSMRQCSRKN